MLQSSKKITAQIETIGKLISREQAHLAALQEADSKAWWSGGYSHVQRVAEFGAMKYAVEGRNVSGLGLHYGTAIVSRLETANARQLTFKKNFPTFSKGFLAVRCQWPGEENFFFEFISLHLDFASSTVRERQLAELAEFLKNNRYPLIICGDFNSDMNTELLPLFLENHQLSTWEQDNGEIITFPTLKARIDWVFVSKEFNILRQDVLEDNVSDHRIVKAVISRKSKIEESE